MAEMRGFLFCFVFKHQCLNEHFSQSHTTINIHMMIFSLETVYIIVCVYVCVPLSCRDIVRSEDIIQYVLVIEFKLQLLCRSGLLFPQEKAQQRLTLQRRDILSADTQTSAPDKSDSTTSTPIPNTV